MQYSKDISIEEIKLSLLKNIQVRNIVILNSPFKKGISTEEDNRITIQYSTQNIDSEKHCGKIDIKNFTININSF